MSVVVVVVLIVDTVDTVDTVHTVDIVHTVHTLDIVHSVHSVNSVNSVNRFNRCNRCKNNTKIGKCPRNGQISNEIGRKLVNLEPDGSGEPVQRGPGPKKNPKKVKILTYLGLRPIFGIV